MGRNASLLRGEFIIPDGTMINGNGHLLIGGEYVESADVVIPLDDDLDMTLASSNADAIRIVVVPVLQIPLCMDRTSLVLPPILMNLMIPKV